MSLEDEVHELNRHIRKYLSWQAVPGYPLESYSGPWQHYCNMKEGDIIQGPGGKMFIVGKEFKP